MNDGAVEMPAHPAVVMIIVRTVAKKRGTPR